jgi:small-conductance mechanosensitive channel
MPETQKVAKEVTQPDMTLYIDMLKEAYADFRNRDQISIATMMLCITSLQLCAFLIFSLRESIVAVMTVALLGVILALSIFVYMRRMAETRKNCYSFIMEMLGGVERSGVEVDEIREFIEKTLHPGPFSKSVIQYVTLIMALVLTIVAILASLKII